MVWSLVDHFVSRLTRSTKETSRYVPSCSATRTPRNEVAFGKQTDLPRSYTPVQLYRYMDYN